MNVSEAVAAQRLESRSEGPIKSLLSWKVLLLVILTVAVYYDVLLRLINQWSNDPNFSHGFIVPLFSAFIVWTKRNELMTIPVEPSSWGLVVVAGSLALVIIGSLGAELFIA